MSKIKSMKNFRTIAFLEGISFILLLFIAMPLKYFFDTPGPVRWLGTVHGILFVLFGILLLIVWRQYKWSFGKAAFAFFCSLVPFGTFYLDRKLKNEYGNNA
jgi:integral membrane protein